MRVCGFSFAAPSGRIRGPILPGGFMNRSAVFATVLLAGLSLASFDRRRHRRRKRRWLATPPNLLGLQRQWERKDCARFRARRICRNYMQRLTARPHHVGSPYDKDNAEWLNAKFKEIRARQPHRSFPGFVFPRRKKRLVETRRRRPRTLSRSSKSPALPEDPTSNQQSEQLPTYNAYSPRWGRHRTPRLCELRSS